MEMSLLLPVPKQVSICKETAAITSHANLNPNNVLFFTPSGSIWLQTIVHLLRSGGNDDFERLTDVFGIMEMLSYPEDTIENRLLKNKKKFVNHKWQQHFTHKFPKNDSLLVGLDPKQNPLIKYIVIMRHGKEVVQSFYPFMNAHTKEFSTMWGGFPPKFNSKQEALSFVTDQMPDFFFGHGKAWWNVRQEPNVLLLRYADLKRDSRTVIQEIASFLNIPLTDETLDVVVKKSSHAYMQKRTAQYQLLVGPNQDIPTVVEGGHIRKDGGKSDGGVTFFTPEMDVQWENAVKKYWGDEKDLVKWILG